MSCFQCDLDIPHVCYEGVPNARWGWTDEAVVALEGAQRHDYMLPADQRHTQRKAPKKKRRLL